MRQKRQIADGHIQHIHPHIIMGDGLGLFISHRLTGLNIPQRLFTVQKITFARGETASVKNASVTGNAVSMIGRYPLASGKV